MVELSNDNDDVIVKETKEIKQDDIGTVATEPVTQIQESNTSVLNDNPTVDAANAANASPDDDDDLFEL